MRANATDFAPAMTNPNNRELPVGQGAGLARQLGLFGTTMAVMGGIIGAGIFINPYIVAERVHTSALILGAWIAGGGIALLGGFIYAELAARLPVVGGQYAYLREALHPAVAFLYGWVLLLVIQTGGMAAVAVTFAKYFLELTSWQWNASAIAAGALALLTAINCFGVRVGSRVQSAMTLTAIAAIGVLEMFSFLRGGPSQISWRPVLERPLSPSLAIAFGSALTPILFAYGGWQTSSFLGAEVRDAKKTLPRGLVLGVLGVIAVYTSVNFVYVRALGPAGLAATMTPASTVMRTLLGPRGGSLIAAGIAFSAFGFLGQSMLTAPRVYFAMAEDGVFFRSVAWVHPRTRVPAAAILLQGVWAMVIALTGTYAQVVNYVVAMDSIFFGLTAVCLFVLRRRAAEPGSGDIHYRVPGHPWTTLVFIAAEWMVVASTFAHDPKRSLIGLGIAIAGLPAYYLWRARNKGEAEA
ncbi:MAG TPA: amino acid permease [Candidatus Methylomirabilis sp.]|nr:amino acid permease [Candidatus Methylomirabilis sp.]